MTEGIMAVQGLRVVGVSGATRRECRKKWWGIKKKGKTKKKKKKMKKGKR